jgi:vacuolar-type H+-ATPase subunit E/Vma4
MGTTELVEKIKSEGRGRVAEVEAERDRAVADIRARAESEAKAIESEVRPQTQRERDSILERARSRARLEQRNAVLAARWEVLDRAAKRAQEKFLADPGYADFIVGLVKKHAQDGSVAFLSEADSKSFGERLGTKLGKPRPLAGGVMIRTGKVELNFSLGVALSELRDELARDLSQVLFEDLAHSKPDTESTGAGSGPKR